MQWLGCITSCGWVPSDFCISVLCRVRVSMRVMHAMSVLDATTVEKTLWRHLLG